MLGCSQCSEKMNCGIELVIPIARLLTSDIAARKSWPDVHLQLTKVLLTNHVLLQQIFDAMIKRSLLMKAHLPGPSLFVLPPY